MKKPICINCPFRNLDSCTLIYLMSDKDSDVTVHVNEMTVSPDCPLVELSTPHGDLVNRQAAIAAIDKEQKEIGVSDVSAMYAYSKCKAIIKQLPPAQPEIIRCRECKFASGDSRICMKFDHSPIGELDFCSFAERREVTT
jgi:hypothetical protein